ncbi:MAG TPA: hypothetical protein VGB14_01780 [Acidimicrobiales bacterium]|jgi:hypothetical protein
MSDDEHQTTTSRTVGWRGWLALACVVGVLIWAGQAALGAFGIIEREEPVSSQSCDELVDTLNDTVADLNSGDTSDRARARLRLTSIDLRVAELGGCPGYDALH